MKAVYGEEHRYAIEALEYLTDDYAMMGVHEGSLEFCENAYQKCRTLLGEDDPITLETLLDLALVYGDLKDTEKAAELK